MPVIPRVYVDAPAITIPYKFGLDSVTDFRPATDPHWQQGMEWIGDNCGADLSNTSAYCVAPAGTNEVQTVTITGTPTGGTFTLSFQGETTAPIPRNATAAQVQAALEALNQIDPGDVTGAGGPLPATAVTLTFTGGRYGGKDVSAITATGSFTGGASPAIAVTTTTPGVTTPKTAQAIGDISVSDPFVLYTMVNCKGFNVWAEAVDHATTRFMGAEDRGIEKALWAQLTAVATTVQDLSQTTAPNPEIGAAILEGWVAAHYAGAGILHCTRTVGSILGTRYTIERHGNRMETHLGMAVSSGAGYQGNVGPDLAAPGAGEAWMFATGEVFAYQGVAEAKGPYMVQSPMDNTQVVMVERAYNLGIDCRDSVSAAIKVKVA